MSETNFPLEPMHDVIIVELEEVATESAGGILLTNVSDNNDRGIVKAVGPGRRTEAGDLVPTTVKVGDRIVWAANTGGPIKLDENENKLMVLSEASIIGILK